MEVVVMQIGAEFWMAHVAANQLEAVPASEYARRHGLAVKSLYYWRRKLLRIAPGGFRPTSCTLALPSGLRLEMSALPQPEWLAALVHAVPGIR
jgi:transposase-like protein